MTILTIQACFHLFSPALSEFGHSSQIRPVFTILACSDLVLLNLGTPLENMTILTIQACFHLPSVNLDTPLKSGLFSPSLPALTCFHVT